MEDAVNFFVHKIQGTSVRLYIFLYVFSAKKAIRSFLVIYKSIAYIYIHIHTYIYIMSIYIFIGT